MKRLYFIAVIPHPELQDEVTELKKFMASTYSAKASLSSPPHLTLFPPFFEDEKNEQQLINALKSFSFEQAPFEVFLNGFGCFRPRTIFVKPEENIVLEAMYNELTKHLKETVNLIEEHKRPFHPHMTIATRDLKKEYFFEALEVFKDKEFKRSFVVEKPRLLKHNGKTWEVIY